LSRYPSESTARFDQQFRETTGERNERLREKRDQRRIDTLLTLIADLSDHLCDEGTDYSDEGLASIRRRVANALPPGKCPDWLNQYRDPPVVQS
jgi:hypothetical protein